MNKDLTKRWVSVAMSVLIGLASRQAEAQPLPPDAPANVRAILAKMQRGVPPTQGEIAIVTHYFQSKASAHPGYRPASSGPPNLDGVKGIPSVVTVRVNGTFIITHDKLRSTGNWVMSGSFPCRLKVSDQGGREAIDAATLALAKRSAEAMGQKLPSLAQVPKRIPMLSSTPLKGSTASFHFISDPDNAAHAARYARVDASASSSGQENSGTSELHGSWVPSPMSGFDMTLTNFNKSDPLFALAFLSGGDPGSTNFKGSVHPDDAAVDMYGGVTDPMPDETAQMPDLVKPGSKITPKPTIKFSTRALQAAVNSGKSATVTGMRRFHQRTNTGSSVVDARGSCTVSISLRPKPVELYVEIEDYDRWVPEGGKDEETKGNQMKVHAELRTADGKLPPAGQMASRIRFELGHVSQEPGVAINWPLKGKATPDFKFDKSDPGDVTVLSDTAAERVDDEGKRDSIAQADATIASFDWGAYGDLRVTATLPDGRVLEGKMKGKSDPLILLPKREASSKIADSWKSISAIDGDDDQDTETSRGNSHNGDGFTLYEEYRGVMAKGVHQYLTATQKDIVVMNKIGELADHGIELFGKASDCKSIKLKDGELDPATRIVNCNHSSVYGGEQHGLIVEEGVASAVPTEPTLRGEKMNDAMATVVPPNEIKNRKIKDTTKIVVDLAAWRSQFPTDTKGMSPEDKQIIALQGKYNLGAAIAHEMGHATGLLHHGKVGCESLTIFPREDKQEIGELAYDEKGVKMDLPPEGLKVLNVGAQGGPESGDADCIMCYTDTFDWAQVPGSGKVNFRFYKVEKIGYEHQSKFCTSSKGTRMNAEDNFPVPMFGDAPNGNCLSKIVIKDW